MAVWNYKCTECGEVFKTKKESPQHCDKPAKKLLSAPATKFMEKVDPFMGKSNLVDQDKIFLERSRNYSRDHELHDLIEKNRDHTDIVAQGWAKEDGSIRKKVDDL